MSNEAQELDTDAVEALCSCDAKMGEDLDAIFDMINGQAAKQFFSQ